MNPIKEFPKMSSGKNIETNQDDSRSVESRTSNLGEEAFPKYPLNSTVTKLNSTFEIKQVWLYNEWESHCIFSKYIRPNFPNKEDLNPKNPIPNRELIQSTFDNVRGQYALWQSAREEGRWKKIEVPNLSLEWVMQNVEILYPAPDRFEIAKLNGIVLWKDKNSVNGKRYKLYEGNHRISAWVAAQYPKEVPAIFFIGKPAKKV